MNSLVRPPEQKLRILQPRCETAEMHQVPVVAVEPAVFDVVDEELEVGWHPRRLDWAEVHAHDGCTWIAVGDLSFSQS